MSPILPVLFVGLFLSAVVGLILQYRFLVRLRTQHAEAWESLGRPTLFLNNSIVNGFAVLRFLWRKDYQALNDPQFATLARILRVYLVAYVFLFLCTGIAMFVFGGSNGV
jgi:hypothetical protein